MNRVMIHQDSGVFLCSLLAFCIYKKPKPGLDSQLKSSETSQFSGKPDQQWFSLLHMEPGKCLEYPAKK